MMKQKRKQIMCWRKVLKKNREEFHACEREEFILCFCWVIYFNIRSNPDEHQSHTHWPILLWQNEPNRTERIEYERRREYFNNSDYNKR